MKQSTGFCTVQPPAPELQCHPLAALPAAGLLSVGAAWLLGVPLPMAAATVLLCVGLLALARFRWRAAAVLTLTVTFCAVFHRQVGAGLLQYANEWLQRLTELTGRIYLPFAVTQSPQTGWFFAPLCLLLSALACRSVRRGGIGFCAVSWAVFASGCALGFFAPAGLLLPAAGTAALALYREGARSWKAFVLPTLCVLPALLLLLLTVPKSTLPAHIDEAIHRLRCDTAACTLPEGRLDELSPRSNSAAPTLALTMETPQKLYLRGFLGEVYTGNGWAALENQTLAEEADRFYRLHESGFYAQSSIGSAAESVDITSDSVLTVTNLAACTGQQYLPYALVGNTALSPDIIGDNRTAGTRETVTLHYLAGSVPEWYALQQALADAQDTPSVAAYLAQEQQYREFVSASCLRLTSEAAAAAERMLDGHLQGRTLPELRTAVLDALDANLTYDETVSTRCGDEEFLTHLLSVGGRGYDIHYATAAVLLLRYCGVPARYVEGYYLPAGEAAQNITLTARHAHAWAEYYLDGVGWIPFEVTPSYIDNEESTATTASDKEYQNPQLPPPVQQPQQKREAPQRSARPAWQFLLLPAVLAAAAAVVRTVLRRRRLKKRLAALRTAAPRDAVAGWYGYAVYLQERTGLTLPDPDAAALNREALFSSHAITAAQTAQMQRYVDAVRALCRKRTPWQRFCDRMLRCIY